MKLFYSIFSGTIYEVFDEEVGNLDEGQVPLKARPHHSCECRGRGYTTQDKERGVFPMCRCMKKFVEDGYKPTTVKLLPKLD